MFSLSSCYLEQSSSDPAGKAVLHLCEWQQEEHRDDRESKSQITSQHSRCHTVLGQSRLAELGGFWGNLACHCLLTTADVCPVCFFFFFGGG